jgi:hypothetical protein
MLLFTVFCFDKCGRLEKIKILLDERPYGFFLVQKPLLFGARAFNSDKKLADLEPFPSGG